MVIVPARGSSGWGRSGKAARRSQAADRSRLCASRSKEVTVEQFRAFRKDHRISARSTPRHADCPVNRCVVVRCGGVLQLAERARRGSRRSSGATSRTRRASTRRMKLKAELPAPDGLSACRRKRRWEYACSCRERDDAGIYRGDGGLARQVCVVLTNNSWARPVAGGSR